MIALDPMLESLSTSEKLDLVELLLESIPETELPLLDVQRRLLRERLEEYRRDPHEGQSLEEFIATDGRTP